MRFILSLILAGFLALAPLQVAKATSPGDPVSEQVKPDGYVLSPAYPNPFNPATQFTLTVAERQTVRVEVFNVLGQRVQLLYAGQIDGGETRTFTFNASNLPSGIYLYRVTGRNFTETRNITLMK